MANLNKVFLAGNLTRDLELRHTPSGTAVAKAGMAVNRSYTTSGGERREETTFVDLEFWGRQAELANQYLGKGSPALIEGRLRYDSWEGQDGQKRSRLLVVVDNVQFLGRPRSGGDYQDSPSGRRDGQDGSGGSGGSTRVVGDGDPAPGTAAADDDDIPF